jgi:hypothetical protein
MLNHSALAKFTSFLTVLFSLFFLAALAVLVMFPSNPLENLPRRDDGVFLYAGNQILSGHSPYLSFWDHKGPAIHYINALGLCIGNGSRWGVWGIEYLLVFLTFFILYKTSRFQWGDVTAFIAVSFFAYIMLRAGTYRLHESNYTETYSVFFNVLALGVCIWFEKKDASAWLYTLPGMLGAVSFLFRPNNMGMVVGIIFFTLLFGVFRRKQNWFLNLVFFMGGFVGVLFVISAWFIFKGIFGEFFDAVFLYNLKYGESGRHGVSNFLQNPRLKEIWNISLIGYALVCVSFIKRMLYDSPKYKVHFLEGVLILAFPFEIFLLSFSGRIYPHYLIVIFPYLALMMGTTVQLVLPGLHDFTKRHVLVAPSLFLSGLAVCLFVLPVRDVSRVADHLVYNRSSGIDAKSTVVQYIKDNSSEEDAVLVWGNDVWVNFLSERISPSKYMYQYPLFLEGYSNTGMINYFLGELTADPPKLIVSMKSVDAEEIVSFEDFLSLKYGHFNLPYEMRHVSDFFRQNYCIRTVLKDAVIYQFVRSSSIDVPCQ